MRKPKSTRGEIALNQRGARPRRRSASRPTVSTPVEPLRCEPLEDRLPLSSDPIVTVNTNFGSFQIELFQSAAPQTVANFLSYVNPGQFNDSIFHRTVPGFVLQGGGFTSPSATFTSTSQFTAIASHGTVPGEPGISNTVGTVAMALSTGPNSGTDEWFINLGGNSSLLDGTRDGGPFTVFGKVLGNGLQVVNQIAAFPVAPNLQSPFDQLPLGANNQLGLITSIVEDGVTGTVFSAPAGDNNVSDRHPLAGVTVFDDANGDGLLDNGEASTVTDANGHYFLNDEAGTYHVRVQTPAGFQATTPSGGESNVTLTSSAPQATQDFGFAAVPPASVSLLTATGSISTTNFTNQNNSAGHTLTFQIGGAANGALVKVFDGQTLIGQATATSSTVDVTTNGIALLSDGPHSITASQVVAGVTTAASPALAITVDTVPPVFTSQAPSATIEAGTQFTYTAHATDGLAVIYRLVTAPAGMTIDGQTGLVSWLPNASQSPSQAVDVRAIDLAGNTADQAFTIFVHDTPPVLAPIANVTIDETKTVQFTVSATDINLPADTLYFTLGGPVPPGATIDGRTGTFVWAPGDGVPVGKYQFNVVATDAAAKSDSQNFSVTITEPNEAPNVSAIPTQAVFAGQTLSFDVQAAGDGDEPASEFTYSLGPGAPTGATIDSKGHFTWKVPSTASVGSQFLIEVRVAGVGASALTTVRDVEVELAIPDILSLLTQSPSPAAVNAVLQSLLTPNAAQSSVLNPRLQFPFDPYAEAATPYGLSSVFTETGLPPYYDNEQLLAGKRVIANKPTGEGDIQPKQTPTKPADTPGENSNHGAWWKIDGPWQRRNGLLGGMGVERSMFAGDEVLAMNAIAKHILARCAPDRAAIDEALADDETIDPYELYLDDDANTDEPRSRGMATAQTAAVSILLPVSAQTARRRGGGSNSGRWPRRLERLQRG
jgi:cyclophilin family peptidyl-prolyl cis-trans isomerase